MSGFDSGSASTIASPAQSALGRLGWKPVAMLSGGLLLLLVLGFLSLTQGLAHVSLSAVVDALFSPKDVQEHHVIRSVRLPRTFMALLSGAALAASGALLQSVTRNPLASETTMGVNAGAYLLVVVGTIFFPAALHQSPLPFAVLGGALAAYASYALGGGRKSTPVRVAMGGMIITLVLSSITSALQLLFEDSTRGLFLWGAGSLVQNDWSGVRFVWPWVVVGLLLLTLSGRRLDLLEFHEETARSLGQKVAVTRAAAMGLSVLLACVSVSVVGPIGFIGLIAPHLVRLSGVRRHSWLLPIGAVWGGALLVGADTLSRALSTRVGELPAGAVTALIGAPWLIWLALRSARHAVQSGGSASGGIALGMNNRKIPYFVWVVVFSLLLAAVCIGALMSGTTKMTAAEVVTALIGVGDEFQRSMLLDFRLPRLLTAALAGMALAASGHLLQSSVRNPMADPSVIGVTGGSAVGAMLVLVALPQLGAGWLPLGAVAGGIATAGIVYACAWRRGLNPTIVALVGIAVSAAASAIVNLLVIRGQMTLAPALAWLAGSTYARDWPEVIQLAALVGVFVPAAWLLGRKVDLLSFGDESSTGLGLPVRGTRLAVGFLAVLLAAVAAANVGTIGFIGLMAPHAARLVAGVSHRRSLLLSVLMGGVLLVAADWVGRVILEPRDIPSGIVAALLGAPYLLWLMHRSKRM